MAKYTKEQKQENFHRVIATRMRLALSAIQRIKNVENRYQYLYTREEVENMIQELRDNVDAVEKVFNDSLRVIEKKERSFDF